MSIEVFIKKDLGSFKLNIAFQSHSRRIGILGASGCGKSLTLKSIAGIEKPDEGRIFIRGREVFNSSKRLNIKPQLRNVGYLFQNYALFPTMTVEQNIAAGLTGKKAQKMRRKNDFRRNFPAGSSRGWLWREFWRMSRKFSCWMNPFRRWTPI